MNVIHRSLSVSSAPDRGPAPRAVPVQEAADAEPGQQLPAGAAIALRGADGPHPAGAAGQPAGGSARGAGRVPAAEEELPGGGGGPIQHAAPRGEGAAVEGRPGLSLTASCAL